VAELEGKALLLAAAADAGVDHDAAAAVIRERDAAELRASGAERRAAEAERAAVRVAEAERAGASAEVHAAHVAAEARIVSATAKLAAVQQQAVDRQDALLAMQRQVAELQAQLRHGGGGFGVGVGGGGGGGVPAAGVVTTRVATAVERLEGLARQVAELQAQLATAFAEPAGMGLGAPGQSRAVLAATRRVKALEAEAVELLDAARKRPAGGDAVVEARVVAAVSRANQRLQALEEDVHTRAAVTGRSSAEVGGMLASVRASSEMAGESAAAMVERVNDRMAGLIAHIAEVKAAGPPRPASAALGPHAWRRPPAPAPAPPALAPQPAVAPALPTAPDHLSEDEDDEDELEASAPAAAASSSEEGASSTSEIEKEVEDEVPLTPADLLQDEIDSAIGCGDPAKAVLADAERRLQAFDALTQGRLAPSLTMLRAYVGKVESPELPISPKALPGWTPRPEAEPCMPSPMVAEEALPTYRVVRNAVVRQRFDRRSKKLCVIEPGALLVALETRENELGQTRVRCEEGWLSVQSAKGAALLELFRPGAVGDAPPEAEAGLHRDAGVRMALASAAATAATLQRYVAVQSAVLRQGFERTSYKCGTLEVGDVVEALEVRMNAAGQPRVRTAAGWVSLLAANGSVLLEPAVAAAKPAAAAAQPAPRPAAAQGMGAEAALSVAGEAFLERTWERALAPRAGAQPVAMLVEFKAPGALGIAFERVSRRAHINSIVPGSVAAGLGYDGLGPGLVLKSIQGVEVAPVRFKRVLAMLRAADRPLALEFTGLSAGAVAPAAPAAAAADGQTAAGGTWRAVRKAKVRVERSRQCQKTVAVLEIGEMLLADELTSVDGEQWLQRGGGWVSVAAADGSMLLERCGVPAWAERTSGAPRTFRAIQRCTVRTGCTPGTPAVGALEVGETVRCGAWARATIGRLTLVFICLSPQIKQSMSKYKLRHAVKLRMAH
jgi:hypothetical protein